MSEQKFTPGPWHLRLSDNATPHIEHGDCLLDDVGELKNRICVMPSEIVQSFNSFANARLIAAAPELLEALEWALRQMPEPVLSGEYTDGYRSNAAQLFPAGTPRGDELVLTQERSDVPTSSTGNSQ